MDVTAVWSRRRFKTACWPWKARLAGKKLANVCVYGLETHDVGEVTIGPCLFVAVICSIIDHVISAVAERKFLVNDLYRCERFCLLVGAGAAAWRLLAAGLVR